MRKLIWSAASISLAIVSSLAFAQPEQQKHDVVMIYMGGNDCPPCVAWRRTELPKLENTELFRGIKFLYVTKVVRSSVPPWLFLPSEVKPFKDRLDKAGGGMIGSSQTAIIVDGQVYDYYFGTRSAADITSMIESITTGSEYPFNRCTRRSSDGQCTDRQ